MSLQNPDPEIEKVLIAPLKFEDVGVRDGGNYTCLLEVKLRNIKSYNVSDYIVIPGDFDQMAGTIPVVLHDLFLILAVSVMLLLSL